MKLGVSETETAQLDRQDAIGLREGLLNVVLEADPDEQPAQVDLDDEFGVRQSMHEMAIKRGDTERERRKNIYKKRKKNNIKRYLQDCLGWVARQSESLFVSE